MKYKLILIFGLLAITFGSCKKEECDKEQYGYLKLKNLTNHQVFVWLNNKLSVSLDAGEVTDLIEKPAGDYSIYAETADKSFFWTGEVKIIPCLSEEKSFQ